MSMPRTVVRSSLLVVVVSLILVASLPANSGGPIAGSGTSGRIAKFTSSNTIGNSIIREDASGNVGIGTTNPAAKFLVAGGRLAVNANAAGSVGALIANQNGSGPIATFSTSNGSNVRMVVESTGNVGIGTPSPIFPLEVAGIIHSTSGGIMFPDGTTQTTASNSDMRTPISSLPITINTCGSYFLTRCLTGVAGQNGLTINSDDVTIDLNGFSLVGVPGSLNGILVQGSPTKRNITIKNGVIRDWGTSGVEAGMSLGFPTNANNGQFIDLKSFNNGSEGLVAGTGFTITSCTAEGNGSHGIRAILGGTIAQCTAIENGGGGIIGGAGSTIRDSVTRLNSSFGILIQKGCVHNSTAHQNSGDGIVADNSLIRSCAAIFSTGTNFVLQGTSFLGDSLDVP